MEPLTGIKLDRKTHEPSESTRSHLAKPALMHLHPPDKFHDLGGNKNPTDQDSPDDTFEVGRHYVKLLPDDAELDSPKYRRTHPEIARIDDLALETLTSAKYDKLCDRDRHRVAIAVGVLSETLKHRPGVLSVDGNYKNDIFLFYGFNTQQESDDYARCLSDMFAKIKSLDVYCKIIGVYSALRHSVYKDKKTLLINKFNKLKGQSGKLRIVVSEDGTVKVSDDNGEFPNA